MMKNTKRITLLNFLLLFALVGVFGIQNSFADGDDDASGDTGPLTGSATDCGQDVFDGEVAETPPPPTDDTDAGTPEGHGN